MWQDGIGTSISLLPHPLNRNATVTSNNILVAGINIALIPNPGQTFSPSSNSDTAMMRVTLAKRHLLQTAWQNSR